MQLDETKRQQIFTLLKTLSYTHSLLFTGLLTVWLMPGLEGPTAVFGWSHGLLWIGMSVLMVVACRLKIVPWSLLLLVSVVGPLLGPFAGSIGFARIHRSVETAR